MQRQFYQRSKSVKNCYRQDTSLYLDHATGPKKGVFFYYNVRSYNDLKDRLMEESDTKPKDYFIKAVNLIMEAVRKSDIDERIKKDKFLIYKIEDALCNFQKGNF
jgi:hypothetical protein